MEQGNEEKAKNLKKYKEKWKKPDSLSATIKTANVSQNSIKALKGTIESEGKNITEVIEEVKKIVSYYSQVIPKIKNAIVIQGGFLTFDEKKYHETSHNC